jgi:cell shape-determining protein MreD
MWLKLLTIAVLFYVLGLIQNSFFVHFNIFGTVPNFIFTLFFILIFFSFYEKNYGWEALIYSVIAGFFLDIFYYSYFGASFLLFLIISIVVKKIFNYLKQKKEKYPIAYFVLLFFVSLIIYEALLRAYFYFFIDAEPKIISWDLGWVFLIKIIYSLVFAIIGFFIYKKLFIGTRDHQK